MNTNDPSVSLQETRATIIIGFGKFGRNTMRHLLVSTATRRVLSWEKTGPREQRLRDLSLILVEETREGRNVSTDESEAYEGGAVEILRDLYQQIQVLKEGEHLEAIVEGEAQRLLDRAARARRTTLPVGLDVIVLASPQTNEAFGKINLLLPKTMERLATYGSLKKSIGNTSSLNFMLIFDFEHYWDATEAAKEVRDSLLNSVSLWEERHRKGKKTFDRIYLLDGWTLSGYVKEKMRVEETSLFLEFLFFEGQRTEMQFLYQQQGKTYNPVSLFGIRMIERSSERLSRLSATRFGYSWLEFLLNGSKSRKGPQPVSLRKLLQSYDPGSVDQLLNTDTLEKRVGARVVELENSIFSHTPDQKGWADSIEETYDEALQELNSIMLEDIHKELEKQNYEKMRFFFDNLYGEINKALSDNVPLRDVIGEINTFTKKLEFKAGPEPSYHEGIKQAFQKAKKLHDDFFNFNSGAIETEQTKAWWFWFAIVLGLAFTPMFVELADTIPKPDATTLLLPELYSHLKKSYFSLLTGISLFALSWGAGHYLLNPRIEYRIRRTRKTFTDSKQGRFKCFVRNNLRKGGALRNPIDAMLKRGLDDVKTSIRSEISRELKRVKARLSERKREMEWLKSELREFLSMEGITPLEEGQEVIWDDRQMSGVRFRIEKKEDFTQLLVSNPPNDDRFRSLQEEIVPFRQWAEKYNDYFLYPVRFIDGLAPQYKEKDPFLQELSQPHPGPAQKAQGEIFKEFIKKHAKGPLAFAIPEQEGVPANSFHCLLPPDWMQLSGVRDELADAGIFEPNTFTGKNPARAYVLRTKMDIQARCLKKGIKN